VWGKNKRHQSLAEQNRGKVKGRTADNKGKELCTINNEIWAVEGVIFYYLLTYGDEYVAATYFFTFECKNLLAGDDHFRFL
jgi:hypothetical protein